MIIDMICKTCGAEVPQLGMYCSAGDDLICQGRAPVAACGAVLTPAERHWYGTTCERCECEWVERVEDWRRGGADAELDHMYDMPPRAAH